MAGLQFLAGGVIQFTDNSGNPLAAGTINTYVTGTSTDKTTYTDSARTIAAANPITLDSNGKAKMYLALNGEYRLLLKTSAGATVDTLDNIAAQQKTHQGCLLTVTETVTNNANLIADTYAETYDTQAFHSAVTNTSRITIPSGSGITKGRFTVTGVWDANATGYRHMFITTNGGSNLYANTAMAITTATIQTRMTLITPIITFAETDYFEVTLYQNSGGNLDCAVSFSLEVIE